MKTIPVCVLVTGLLLPSVCLAQPGGPPRGERGEKAERRGQGRDFMAAWKTADTDGDGTISQEEFEAMPRVSNLPEDKRAHLFKRLDKSGDGKLSREELGRLGKSSDGEGPPMKRLWELDVDKSGGVSYEEFKTGGFFKKLPPDKQEMVFKRLDTDGDGVISPKDRPDAPFKKSDGKRGPKSERSMDGDNRPSGKPGEINEKLDLNGDGALSFDEFRLGPAMKGLSEDQQEDRFELLDRNGDRKISPEDIPPAGE